MLQLYDYFRSSAAFRVRLALNYKQLDYQKIKINLLTCEQSGSEYAKRNPAQLVPLLSTADDDSIHQSLAIIEYLEECYPLPALLPSEPVARAHVRALALDVACDIHPLNNLRVLKYLKNELGHDETTVNQWYQHWIHQGLASIENWLKTSAFYTGAYCYRDQFTLADACLLPQLVNARRYEGDVSAYPILLAIEQRCKQHDWVNEAYPEVTA